MSSAYERMSIEENIKFFAEIRGVKKERAIDLLKEMHLFEARKTLVKKCSKGMRQRLILASAIMHEPELLFLDEPTSGLDPATIQAVHKILLELNRKGTTIFLTTHNMEEADKLCNRVGILNQGKIIACGSPEELKLSYAKNEIEVMRADRTKITVGKDEQGIEQILELMRNKDCLTIHSKEPNLEEIFIQLTGREF